jgi:Uma2 family endonuclease
MLAQKPLSAYNRSAFLEWETAQQERYELVGGVIKATAGGTVDHNRIAGNIYAVIRSRLGGAPCEAFQQNMKLTPKENEDSTNPDILVLGRSLEGGEPSVDTATVIVEVTSPSSEQDGLIRKSQGYQQIDGLRHYLVVSQNKADVQLYSRASARDPWIYRRIASLDGTVGLPAIGVELQMAEIFARTRLCR